MQKSAIFPLLLALSAMVSACGFGAGSKAEDEDVLISTAEEPEAFAQIEAEVPSLALPLEEQSVEGEEIVEGDLPPTGQLEADQAE